MTSPASGARPTADGLPEGHVAVDWADLHWAVDMIDDQVPYGHWRLDRMRAALEAGSA